MFKESFGEEAKLEKKEPSQLEKEPDFIKGTIERLDDRVAEINLNDGQKILWPKERLSRDHKEGDEVLLSLIKQEELAKEILNIILKPTEDNEPN